MNVLRAVYACSDSAGTDPVIQYSVCIVCVMMVVQIGKAVQG